MNKKEALLQNQNIRNYYQFQSTIYDATRWSFLFGRNALIRQLARITHPEIILEIGSGTGHNLKNLSSKFPIAKIYGLDVSTDMIQLSRKKTDHLDNVTLLERPYNSSAWADEDKPDVIVFSYMLTMVNPGYETLIAQAYEDLKPGGFIAIVDFHFSTQKWFRNHMSKHHVRMEKHLDASLENLFKTEFKAVKSAYLGVWDYFLFLGRK